MSENKTASRAEKAVSDVKKKKGTSSSDPKAVSGKKNQKPVELPDDDTHVPGRVTFAVITLALFLVFLVKYMGFYFRKGNK